MAAWCWCAILTVVELHLALFISRFAIQSIEHKRVLEQTCRQSHLLVCQSVSLSLGLYRGVLWQNGWLDLRVVSGVSRRMGVLDGGGDRRQGRGRFGSKCGVSCCNQWHSYSLPWGWRCSSSQTTLGFLVSILLGLSIEWQVSLSKLKTDW